jgi:hypothetical protein
MALLCTPTSSDGLQHRVLMDGDKVLVERVDGDRVIVEQVDGDRVIMDGDRVLVEREDGGRVLMGEDRVPMDGGRVIVERVEDGDEKGMEVFLEFLYRESFEENLPLHDMLTVLKVSFLALELSHGFIC